MRGDFSRFTHDSLKRYIATFMQQGRVQLDADWNQNVQDFLDMLWKQSRDSLGTCACIGDSFRVGRDIPIDHMLQASLWKPVHHDPQLSLDPDGYIFLNTNDRPRTNPHSTSERGSLFVENAGGILREFRKLDLSRFKSIYVKFKFIGRPFQVSEITYCCPHCNQPYRKGESQYCSKCGTELKEEFPNNENSCNSINEEVSTWLRLDDYGYKGQFIEANTDAGGFCKVKFNLLEPEDQAPEKLEKYDLSHISKLSVHWERNDNKSTTVCIGLISAEPMAVVVSSDASLSTSSCWANIAIPDDNNKDNENNDNDKTRARQDYYTYNGKPTINKQKDIKEISWSFSIPKNFHSLDVLRFAIRNDNSTTYSYKLFLVNSNFNSNNNMLEYSLSSESGQEETGPWRSYIVDLKKPSNSEKFTADDLREILKEINTIGLKDLPENDSLYISEILGEVNFENDFLISGDMNHNQSATMYVNGILCSIEHWDTYLTQKDALPDNVDYLLVSSTTDIADGKGSYEKNQGNLEKLNNPIYYAVYVDVWNRGITHLEDPEIKEVALGGSDTATRLQTICQIKLREIESEWEKDVNSSQNKSSQKDLDPVSFQDKIVDLAERKIKEMNEERSARLSVIGPRKSSSLLSADADIGMLGNHLYRIQIHDSVEEKVDNNKHNSNGNENIDNRATFKWSKDNASVAFPIKQLSKDKVVLEQGGRRLAGLFRIGDFIEIMDDKDELSEQPRGEMRRITDIDIDKRTLFWSSSKLKSDQMEVKNLHDPIKTEAGRYRKELHPKVILWDGLEHVSATQEGGGEEASDRLIPLNSSSGVNGPIKIKFDPGILKSGDYWIFTTRSNGDIESLRSAKPMGPKHAYAPLALIKKESGKEIEVIEDLRHTFQPLTNLRAIDIPYDSRYRIKSDTSNVQAAISNVQSAIQRLSDGKTRILHGYGNKDSISDLLIQAGEIYELRPAAGSKRNFTTAISFNDIYQHPPFLIYTINSTNKGSSDVIHKIRMVASDEEGNIVKDAVDDGTKNYAWRGFEVEAEEDAQISWLAIGDSYTYFERFVKRILDEVFRIIFGLDTDQLRADSSVLDAWYKKDLRNLSEMSESGPDLAKQAREHWDRLQHHWDRIKRQIDNQVGEIQEEFEEAFSDEKEEKSEEPQELSAQTINCPNCGHPYPKGKYAFCTKCGTEMTSS